MSIKEPNGERTSPRSLRTRYIFSKDQNDNIPEIIDAILAGLSISKIHPSIFPFLYPQLTLKHKQLLAIKNSHGAQLVKKALDEIDNETTQHSSDLLLDDGNDDKYRNDNNDNDDNDDNDDPNMNEKEIELKKYETYLAEEEERRKNSAEFTEEELAMSVQMAINDEFDEIDSRILKKLSPELKRLQKLAIADGRYLDAGRFHDAARKIQILSTKMKYDEMTAVHADHLETKVFNMSFDLARLKQKWNKKISEAKRLLDRDISLIIQDQKERLKEFDELFDQDIPISYCKYTNIVSELKKKEEYLVLSKRFNEAAEMREQIEAQMREEEKTFRVKYNQDMMFKRDDFINKIEQRIRIRQDAANTQIDKLMNDKRREIDQAKKALKRFELQSQHADEIANGAQQMMASMTNSNTASTSSNSNSNSGSNYNHNYNYNHNNNYDSNFGNSIIMTPASQRRNKSERRDRYSNENVATPVRSPRSARSNRGKNNIGYGRTNFPTSQERCQEEMFRQRRAINSILYTRTHSPRLPKIRK